MWVTLPTTNSGYTLLELLIVLVLMGLISGLAFPRLSQVYDSVQFSIERDNILFQIESLPFQVYQRGVAINLRELEKPLSEDLLALPEGWSLDKDASTDVHYNALGFCSGGELTLVKQERELALQLTPPMCRPQAL